MTPARGCSGSHSAAIPSSVPVQATAISSPETGGSKPSRAMGVAQVPNIRKITEWSMRTSSSTLFADQSRPWTTALTPSIAVIPSE